jgi:hypothetical protein
VEKVNLIDIVMLRVFNKVITWSFGVIV